MSSHQLNYKTNDLVSFVIKDYLKVLKLFLSPVAADGMYGNGLKFEKIGQIFQVLMLRVPKILKNFIMLALSDKINLISSS